MKYDEKNTYTSNTPEWQLFENMRSNEMLVKTYTEDIERYEEKRKDAAEKAERYRKALDKLTKE